MLNNPKGEKHGYTTDFSVVGWISNFIISISNLIIPLDKSGNNVYNVVSIVDKAFIL